MIEYNRLTERIEELEANNNALQDRINRATSYLNEVMAQSGLCRREGKGLGCHVCALLVILNDNRGGWGVSDRTCPTHGGPMTSAEWWRHGDECADMCVECDEYHTSDVGCAFITVSLDFMDEPTEGGGE